jgi:hypothetical protein
MRNNTGKYLTLVAGLIVALSVIFSQSFSVTITSSDIVETEIGDDATDQTEQDETPGRHVTVSVSSLPAPVVIHFIHQASCLFELDFTARDAASFEHPVAVPLKQFFSALLGAVISPNAP